MKVIFVDGPAGRVRVGPKSADGWEALVRILGDGQPRPYQAVEDGMVAALTSSTTAPTPEINARAIAEARIRDAFWAGIIERPREDLIRLVSEGVVHQEDTFGPSSRPEKMADIEELGQQIANLLPEHGWVPADTLLDRAADLTGRSRSVCSSVLNWAVKEKRLLRVGRPSHPEEWIVARPPAI